MTYLIDRVTLKITSQNHVPIYLNSLAATLQMSNTTNATKTKFEILEQDTTLVGQAIFQKRFDDVSKGGCS